VRTATAPRALLWSVADSNSMAPRKPPSGKSWKAPPAGTWIIDGERARLSRDVGDLCTMATVFLFWVGSSRKRLRRVCPGGVGISDEVTGLAGLVNPFPDFAEWQHAYSGAGLV